MGLRTKRKTHQDSRDVHWIICFFTCEGTFYQPEQAVSKVNGTIQVRNVKISDLLQSDQPIRSKLSGMKSGLREQEKGNFV